MINFDHDKSDPKNQIWLDDLIEEDKFSVEFYLRKVIDTVVEHNPIKSVLNWTDFYIDGYKNRKGFNDKCILYEREFLDTFTDLFNGTHKKYDLVFITSEELFFNSSVEDIFENEDYDKILNKIFDNHLTDNGKLIILDIDSIISGFPNPRSPYDSHEYHCNSFRLSKTENLEASINIALTDLDHDQNTILILSKNPVKKTLIFDFGMLNMPFTYFDHAYSNKNLQCWIELNHIFFADFIEDNHIDWHENFILHQHLGLDINYSDKSNLIKFWNKIDNNIASVEKFYNHPKIEVYHPEDWRYELEVFHRFSHVFSDIINGTAEYKSFLSSYFIGYKHDYDTQTNFKYFVIKNNYLQQWNKSKLNDNEFSSLYFEGFKFHQLSSDINFLKIDSKYSFENQYELMFSHSKTIYNLITVDFENDFINKSEDTISNLVLSFFNHKHHESSSNLYILVNNDVLSSNEYQSFRKEFSHILYSIVKIGNEFMLLFKHSNSNKVFISTEHNDNSKRLKLNYSNPLNFLSKNEDFYKNWIDTSNLSINPEEDKMGKLLKEIKLDTTQIKSDTSEIKADMKSMMSEVSKIKSSTEDTNESIDNSISLILESVEKNYDLNDIDKYINKVTQWFNYWDKIENNTKTFMPGSELLYDNIKNSVFEDFSPFILYYCRALENELLNKIFLKFHTYFNSISIEKQEILFNWNKDGLTDKELKQYKQTFDGLNSNIKNNKHTLGSMRFILSIIPNAKKKDGSKRYQRSPLLKEFYIFIKKEFGDFDPKTLKQLENIITNYRNKSAHVDIINEENALVFYEDFKELMNKLIKKL